MRRYVADFKAAAQITRMVGDFLAIAERSDASFILMAMALRAFDKVTLEAPFIGLHNAMYERWDSNFDPHGIFKAVVLMAPCFFGDNSTYAYWRVPDAEAAKKAIKTLAQTFGLEIRDDTISDLLAHAGVFAQEYYGPRRPGIDGDASSSSDVQFVPSLDEEEDNTNQVMPPQDLDYCLRAQESSIQWWESISRMVKADGKLFQTSAFNDAERRKSYANLVALWDILMAITPTEVDIERVFSMEGRIMTPIHSRMKPDILNALTCLKMSVGSL